MTTFSSKRVVFILKDNGYRIDITPPSFMGGRTVSVMLTSEQFYDYLRWDNGELLIQDALPGLSTNDREKLMSGLDQATFDEFLK